MFYVGVVVAVVVAVFVEAILIVVVVVAGGGVGVVVIVVGVIAVVVLFVAPCVVVFSAVVFVKACGILGRCDNLSVCVEVVVDRGGCGERSQRSGRDGS